MTRKSTAIFATVLALLLLAVYWPTLFGHPVHTGFAWVDDELAFVRNPHLQVRWDPDGLAALVSRPFFFDWTPLYWALVWVQRGLFGNTAAAFRAVSLAAFWLAMLVLYRLLSRWTGRRVPCAFAVLALAAHPLMVEALVWPTTQKTVLSLLCALLALQTCDRLLKDERIGPQPALRLAAFLLVAASLAIKLRGLVLPFCLAAYEICLRPARAEGRPWRRALKVSLARLGPMMLFALAWAAWQQLAVFERQGGGGPVERYLGGSLGRSLASHAVVELRTLGHWLMPHELRFFYAVRVYNPTDWQPWCAALAVLGFLGLAVAAAPAAYRRLALFGVAWYALQRAITAGLFPYQWSVMADRYSLVPSVGLVLLATAALLRARGALRSAPAVRSARLAAAAFVLMLAMMSWIHSTRLLSSYGAAFLTDPDHVQVRFDRLRRARGPDVEALWSGLRDDPAAPMMLGRTRLAWAAAHWGKERHARGLPAPDAEVIRRFQQVPDRQAGRLVLAGYYAGTGRPQQAWPLLQAALDEPPHFRRWLDDVQADLEAGRERDWRTAYMRIGDGYAREGELRCWETGLHLALRLAPRDAAKRRVAALGRGIYPDHPFWRRQWEAVAD